MELRGIIPARYVPPDKPAKYDQLIIVNWLNVEVPTTHKMPVLNALTRWRNKEVFYFIRGWDWTAQLYGTHPPKEPLC